MANNVLVNIGVTGAPATQQAFNDLNLQVNQFTQNVEQSSARAGSAWGSFIERFAIRQLLNAATREVEDFFKASIKAAKEAEAAEALFNSQILVTAQSYRAAQAARAEFHNLTGATGAQANQATASASEIAFRAGLTSDNDARIQKAVADIVAARGGGAAETTKALQKLSEGSSEVIRELTGKTSDEAERAYALLHDKLPKDLLPFEKSLAQVNAVVDHSKLFTGEAASHLDTLSGKIEQGANKWEDFKAGVGDAVLSSAQLRDVLDSVLLLFGELPGASRKGFRSVEDAGREAEANLNNSIGGGLKSFYNRVELGAKAGFATLGGIFSGDVFTQRGRTGFDLAGQYREDIINRDRINAEEIAAAQNREILSNQFRRLKQGGISSEEIQNLFRQATQYGGAVRESFIEAGIDKLLKGVEEKRIANEKTEQQQERDIQLQKSRFERQISAASHIEDFSSRIQQLGSLRGQIEKLPGNVYDANDKESLASRIEAETQAARKAFDALRAQGAELFDTLGAKVAHDNPFVKLAADSDRAITSIRERFKGLGDEAVESLVRMQHAADAVALSNLRIQSSLKAVELEFQAEHLQKGYVGITAEQQRQLGVMQKQFDALTNAPALRREAEAFERGFLPQTGFQLQRELREDYERVKRLRPEGTSEAARAGQKIIDDYIIQQTQRLPLSARVSGDPRIRGLADDRARALNARADRFDAEIQDELKRAQASRFGIELANKKLEELARLAPGSDPNSIRQEFLSITKALDPKEISGALKEGQIIGLREEANYQRGLEQDAKNFRAALIGQGGILYQIKDAIENAGGVKGEEAGDVLRINQTYYPSKAAYEAAQETGAASLADFARTFTGKGAATDARPTSEEIYAFVKAQSEGRIFGDVAGLATNPKTSVEVNPFAQELFRARPGYSTANDPRSFDAGDPYQREFLNAGYFDNLRSSSYSDHTETMREMTKQMKGLTDRLDRLSEHGLKLNGDAARVEVEVIDRSDISRVSVLGNAF